MMKSDGRKRRRILVVDDEQAIQGLANIVLGAEGIEVDVADNGTAATEMVERNVYDLLLVDIKTPQMNGRQLYRWLLEKRPNLADRVLFITGDTVGDDTRAFLHNCGRHCLPKPFTPDSLIEAVRRELAIIENAEPKG